MLKICNNCKIEKEDKDFYKNYRAKDGLQSNCKDCTNTKVSEWKHNKLERSRELNRNHYQNYKNSSPELYSLWRLRNKPTKNTIVENNT